MEELKTSNEWWHEHPQFDSHRLATPDGWDMENLHFSWYQEKITFAEFERRLSLSTLVPKIDPV